MSSEIRTKEIRSKSNGRRRVNRIDEENGGGSNYYPRGSTVVEHTGGVPGFNTENAHGSLPVPGCWAGGGVEERRENGVLARATKI